MIKLKTEKPLIDLNGLDKRILKEIILSSDCLITDLDGTIADPAKQIAIYDNIFNGRIFNPAFALWIAKTGISYIKNKKAAESESWKEYVRIFLRNIEELHKIEERFSNGKVDSLLYSRVREFYKLLPKEMFKFLVTRNILEVGNAFAKGLNISIVAEEIFKKARETEQVITQSPNLRRYLVFDDYAHDFEAVLDVLQFYRDRADKSKRIESYSGIFVTDSKVNNRAIANIGKDYSGLVEILKAG